MSYFPKPLKGIRVIDFSYYLPGPYCTNLLAAYGAEVIKVEGLNGDPLRKLNPALFQQINGDKSAVMLDYSTPQGQQQALALTQSSHLVIDGFRPGVGHKLGLDAASLRANNPALVVASISGYGYSGPYSQHAAHDLTTMAVGGYFSMASSMEGKPSRPHVRLADLQAGQMAAMASMMALQQAQQTGQGCHIDASMFDASAHMALPMVLSIPPQVPDAALTVENMPQVMADSEMYLCSDGKYIAIATMEDKFWINLASVIGTVNPALNNDAYATRKGRDRNKIELYEQLKQTFITKSRDQWLALTDQVDTIAMPVYEGREMLQDQHLKARQLTQSLNGVELSLMPVCFDGQRNTISTNAPSLGADNQRLLSGLGN